jgi:hypothetical protein
MAGKEYWESSFKRGMPQKNILMLEDHEGVRKNMKIIHLEKKMRKNDLLASLVLRGEDFRRKIRNYQKIP